MSSGMTFSVSGSRDRKLWRKRTILHEWNGSCMCPQRKLVIFFFAFIDCTNWTQVAKLRHFFLDTKGFLVGYNAQGKKVLWDAKSSLGVRKTFLGK